MPASGGGVVVWWCGGVWVWVYVCVCMERRGVGGYCHNTSSRTAEDWHDVVLPGGSSERFSAQTSAIICSCMVTCNCDIAAASSSTTGTVAASRRPPPVSELSIVRG